MDEFVTLKKFNTYIEATGIVELLNKNEIAYQVEKAEASGDIVFAGNTLDEELHVKVKSSDYEAAQKLLEELTEVGIDKLEKDYYLFEFSDNELLEILEKPDEWSLNDYHWALDILKQRGIQVEKAKLDQMKKARLEVLSQPEKVDGKHIGRAYLFCFLGGIVGFFMGRHLHTYRKLLPNGQKVFAYDEASRLKGKRIEMIGLICLLVYVVLIFFVVFIS